MRLVCTQTICSLTAARKRAIIMLSVRALMLAAIYNIGHSAAQAMRLCHKSKTREDGNEYQTL